jgi:hypothetical protein
MVTPKKCGVPLGVHQADVVAGPPLPAAKGTLAPHPFWINDFATQVTSTRSLVVPEWFPFATAEPQSSRTVVLILSWVHRTARNHATST